MSDALYHQAILDHARAAVGAGRLDAAHGKATVDNPICGDRITVEVRMADGVIDALAHQVRGCLLCEAAASVIAQRSKGMKPDQFRSVAEAFDRMVRAGGPVPDGWPELEVFHPVQAARSRHTCVLLPFQAADRALADAGS